MKSKISFFDKGIFNNALRRFMPLWIAYFVLAFIMLPFMQLIRPRELAAQDVVDFVTGFIGGFTTISMLFAAIICACAAFSFMYRAKTTGLICSLPVKREAVFCSAYLAGYVPIVFANVVNVLLVILMLIGDSNFGIAAGALGQWLAVCTLQFTLFYGIAVFTAMLTGAAITLPLLYFIFNFLAVVMELVVRNIMNPFIYGLAVNNGSFLTEVLSPAIYLIQHNSVTYDIARASFNSLEPAITTFHYNQWCASAIYCAVGIALSIAALVMFKKRRMECTGDVIAIRVLRPVFKYGVTACAALCSGIMIYSLFNYSSANDGGGIVGVMVMLLFMFTGAFVGYFGSEMLLRRSFHVFKTSWLGLVVSCAICVIFVGSCYIDVLGLETKTPDPNELESISFNSYDVTVTNPEYFDDVIALQLSLVANKDYHCKFVDSDEYHDYGWCYIVYEYKDGHREGRGYYVMTEEKNADADELERLLNLSDNLSGRFPGSLAVTPETVSCAYYTSFTGPDTQDGFNAVEISPAQAADFYNSAIKPDIEAGSFGLLSVYDNVYEWADNDIGTFELEISTSPNGNDYSYYYIEITTECINCMQWLAEHPDIASPVENVG